ncbi:MAG: thiol-activated cytolysin family protein [Bacteroidota bacterium]|uniref:Thiol-activated cytolysin family protein n=1 Tax=Flagellimonas okinawensis TaxID=3031324 RepID=A0ABT5XIN9_9FLAO|nr:thiol-activated cytolysin family protein [[Muricauda] okinawensis]MDF0705768.1 thiol-activated cytolysin family protein [[Muricauda] okinawensis]MEC8832225.1 thiol-activated cytolysin family protein [Bacteroidota bacterium]
MKTLIKIWKIGVLLLFASITVTALSCSSDGGTEPAPGQPEEPQYSEDEALEFNNAMANLQALNQPDESPIEETNSSDPERDVADTTLECYTKTYSGAPGFDEMFTLDPTTDVIYPGALLNGESITSGEYIGINASRAPITVSTSLSNISGSPSIVIEDPNQLSEVRAGINELLSREVTGATPAQVSLDITEVHSEQHMSVAIGANYRGVTKKVSADLQFNGSSYKHTYVLKFIQRYFTLDLNSPGQDPSDLFTDLPDINSLGAANPVYVSSVTYGRMVLYTVESNATMSEVKLAFDASVGSTDGSIDAEYQQIMNSSNIKAMIIGGSGDGAVQAINGPDEVYNFISEGGNYSPDSPGAPLAYKLRFVKEGFPVARVILATEYQVRECDLAYPEYLVTIDRITGTQPSDTEVYGTLRVKMRVGGVYLDANGNGVDDGTTWSRDSSNFVDVQNDKTYTVGQSYTFKPYRPNMAIDHVEYYGNLWDYNGLLPDGNLGSHTGTVKLEDLDINDEVTETLSFNAGITAHFKFVRIK